MTTIAHTSTVIRAGDRDREKTANLLGRALAQGYLDMSEYERRVQTTFATNTTAELRELVAALRDRAWFGALEDFGAFWIARDREQPGRFVNLRELRQVNFLHPESCSSRADNGSFGNPEIAAGFRFS